MLFNGVLQKGKELSLVDALLEADAAVDFRKAEKREPPLIGAASRGAENVELANLSLDEALAKLAAKGLISGRI